MFQRILVAYDGSEGSRIALRRALELGGALQATVATISVEEHLPYYAASLSEVKGAKEQIDEHFRTLTKQARDAALLSGMEIDTIVRQGHEVESIVAAAKEGTYDLLVIGYHGHSGIFGRSMGSTAEAIVRFAPCPVLLAK